MTSGGIERTVPTGVVSGTCAPEFEPVLKAFLANFDSGEEYGASLCVQHRGETVVDLWGGLAEPETRWDRETVSVVFSCTKAATALCAHHLIDAGKLELHAPVTRYWPEFGVAGKENVSVAMMLNHSAGVPALREPVKDGGMYDWDYMVARLAAETPFWEPGTRNGYHMMTFGWTVGELVRRVSGRSLGTYFREEIAAPLGLDFWIGLPESEEARVAPMIEYRPGPDDATTALTAAIRADRSSIPALAVLNRGGMKANSRAAHAAELGGGGGIANARALAGLFAPLCRPGTTLFSSRAIRKMEAVSVATGHDATLMIPTRFGLGLMKSMDNRHRPTGDLESVVLGARAFGHVGAGGSIGFADPECELAFGYTMNRMGAGLLLNARGQALVDATYIALGYDDNTAGSWHRA